jgi:nitroreductase
MGVIFMETMEAIFSRRSIRKYLPDPVSRDRIENILKAGMSAPSAGDEQPWPFIIINRHDLLERFLNASLRKNAEKCSCCVTDLRRSRCP